MNKVTAIVPAYNEEKRIAAVLGVLSENKLIDEIIVIDDFSKDRTRETVRQFPKVQLLCHEKNFGKTHALYTGLTQTQAEFIFLVDADLVGLTNEDVTAIITPVLSGTADMTISLRGNTPFLWKFIGLDYISGERVLRKGIFANHLDELLSLPKFGFEVFLNNLIIKNYLRIKVVPWKKVSSPYKIKKYGFFVGLWGDIAMLGDIVRVISPFTIMKQIVAMRRLAK